jgi:hypothetical protein
VVFWLWTKWVCIKVRGVLHHDTPRQCMNCIFQISSTEESAGKLHEA